MQNGKADLAALADAVGRLSGHTASLASIAYAAAAAPPAARITACIRPSAARPRIAHDPAHRAACVGDAVIYTARMESGPSNSPISGSLNQCPFLPR